VALTITVEVSQELAQASEHLNKFYQAANSNAAAWTDAQWDHLSELYNGAALLRFALESLVKANRGGGIAARPAHLKRRR
jgi:hypothetical protein